MDRKRREHHSCNSKERDNKNNYKDTKQKIKPKDGIKPEPYYNLGVF